MQANMLWLTSFWGSWKDMIERVVALAHSVCKVREHFGEEEDKEVLDLLRKFDANNDGSFGPREVV